MKLQKISAFAGIFVAAALLTACGTNTPAAPDTNAAAATSAPSAPAATASPAAAPAAGPKVLKVVTLSGFSPIVTNGTGRTIYRFDKDKANPATTTCFDECAKTWQPVLAGPNDTFAIDGNGINKNLMGFIDRPEGRQVTLKGWPLYYYKDDVSIGQTAGYGKGGTWFAIAPDGSKAKQTAPAASPSGYGY